MSDTADKTYALRLPMWLYKDVEELAQDEMRSVKNMIAVLLLDAVVMRRQAKKELVNEGQQKARSAEQRAE